MYKIVVTMTFAWPQLSFQGYNPFPRGFHFPLVFILFQGYPFSKGPYPFSRIPTPRKVLILHAKEGQPAVAQPLLAGLSLHAASKIEHAFSKAVRGSLGSICFQQLRPHIQSLWLCQLILFQGFFDVINDKGLAFFFAGFFAFLAFPKAFADGFFASAFSKAAAGLFLEHAAYPIAITFPRYQCLVAPCSLAFLWRQVATWMQLLVFWGILGCWRTYLGSLWHPWKQHCCCCHSSSAPSCQKTLPFPRDCSFPRACSFPRLQPFPRLELFPRLEPFPRLQGQLPPC